MLARLVVHIQSRHQHLMRGLQQSATGTQQFAAVVNRSISVLDVYNQAVSNASTEVSVMQAKVMGLAKSVSVVSSRVSAFTRLFRITYAVLSTASEGLGAIAAALTAVVVRLTAAIQFLKIILLPLHGAFMLLQAAMSALSVALSILLAPFRLLLRAVSAVLNVALAVITPILRFGIALATLWVQIKGTMMALQWFGKLLALLPPHLRVLVIGLTALGASGKVGAAALRMLGSAAKIAATGMQLLLLPIMLIRNPAQAAAVAFQLARTAITGLGKAANSAVGTVRRLGRAMITAGQRGASAMVKAGKSFSAFSGGILTRVAQGMALIATAGAGIGLKMAATAEQAQVAFTTMLKDGNLAKAVLQQLEGFSASTPFQLTNIRDGAKQLLNAQVPVGALQKRLTMLGDIAAGTGKPLLDYVRIFSKIKATGKVGLESLNQLAERGVPIYSALQDQLGVSRTKMLEMISAGKVGFKDMDGALQSLTATGGVFAGGMQAQSVTLSGLWSTLKDNVGLALQSIMQMVSDAFDFKGAMASSIAFVQRVRAGITSIGPVVFAFAATTQAAFLALFQMATAVWNGIMQGAGTSAGSIAELMVTALAMAEFGFQNWQSVATLVLTNIQLGIVQLGSVIGHFFTQQIPGYLTFFAENWKAVFFTAFDLVTTIFINMGTNIRRIMGEIWEFIKSGGTSTFKVAWVPLTEGFHNSISKIPDIPPRIIGPLEAQLKKESQALGAALGSGMQQHVNKRLRDMDELKSKFAETARLGNQLAIPQDETEDETASDGAAGQGSKDRTFKAVTGAEAFSQVVKAMMRGNEDPVVKVAKQQLAAQNKQADSTEEVAQLLREAPPTRIIESFA